MRLLFVFPFCSRTVNSISGGPIYLGSAGHQVLVIAARHADSLKGKVDAEEHETAGGTEFYRPYGHSRDLIERPFACWKAIREKLEAFRPEAVICFGEFNYRMPMRVSREFGIPMFLYMEYLRPEKIAFPMRARSVLRRVAPSLHNYLSRLFLGYLAKRVEAIMYAYYGDRPLAGAVAKLGAAVHYVPWCAEVEGESAPVARERKVGIYIGSLEAFKNAAELVEAIPVILDKTDTERFIVVGPGSYAEEIKRLIGRYGDRLQYIGSVPREEAMRMIRAAGYGFTPVKDCGLGFIGDCWGNGTPLVATHELEGFLQSGVDTLVAKDVSDLPRVINELLRSEDLYDRMRRAGRARFETDYTAKAAGERYLAVINDAREQSN